MDQVESLMLVYLERTIISAEIQMVLIQFGAIQLMLRRDGNIVTLCNLKPFSLALKNAVAKSA